MLICGRACWSSFGGHNETLPQETVTIQPDMAEHVPDLAFPSVQVAVLSPMRTFWEKVTLIHVECHRPELRHTAEQLSRHRYDLARLAGHEVGRRALDNTALLHDVLRIKEIFFRRSLSHYESCATGALRLIPDTVLRAVLRHDYQAMQDAQMFYGEALFFDDIVERLSGLEREINARLKS